MCQCVKVFLFLWPSDADPIGDTSHIVRVIDSSFLHVATEREQHRMANLDLSE